MILINHRICNDIFSLFSTQIIIKAGEEITRGYEYIQIIKDFNFESREERNKSMKTLRDLESKLSNEKENFENLTQKIKEQGQKLIDSCRNSIRVSRTSNQQGELLIDEKVAFQEIEKREKQINSIQEVTKQINEISKQTAESVYRTGENLNTIENNVVSMDSNIEKAVKEMKEAKDLKQSGDGYSNMLLYIIAGIVCLLILVALIMPK